MRVLKFLLFVVVVAAAGAWFVVTFPYGPTRETFVEIAPGTGTPGIAAELERAGIIRSAVAFEAMKEYRGGSLKAGEYRFDHPVAMGEVYGRLVKGDVFTLTLVIPEGYNIFDIAGAVQAAGLGSAEEFLAAEKEHTELVKQWAPRAPSLEGYLFPDTYKFGRHATPLQMLTAMVKRFGVVGGRLGILADPGSRVEGPEGSVAGLVTMASLVEKEVHVDTERPLVAGVFENRLAAGMPLQTDPAVAYASLLRGTWTGVIHQSELRSDSAYNTYTHAGLPPGPICNPGVAAMKAVLHPAKTDYLYFVAGADGITSFSATLGEHNQQVAELLGRPLPVIPVEKKVMEKKEKRKRR